MKLDELEKVARDMLLVEPSNRLPDSLVRRYVKVPPATVLLMLAEIRAARLMRDANPDMDDWPFVKEHDAARRSTEEG